MAAFTESDKIAISKILKVSLSALNSRMVYLGELITPDLITAVRVEIDRWQSGAGGDFVSIEPNATNSGVRIDPEREKNDIRENIRTFLELTDSSFGGSDLTQTRLYRG